MLESLNSRNFKNKENKKFAQKIQILGKFCLFADLLFFFFFFCKRPTRKRERLGRVWSKWTKRVAVLALPSSSSFYSILFLHEEHVSLWYSYNRNYRILLTDSLHSDTHNSVRLGKCSRFSSSVIACPMRDRLCRPGKYSMPIILGKPEKNISKDVTFLPEPFWSFSNLTPFTVHCNETGYVQW